MYVSELCPCAVRQSIKTQLLAFTDYKVFLYVKYSLENEYEWHDVHNAMSTSKFNLAYLNDVHCTMLMSKFVY